MGHFLDDAARHLSQILDEPVSKADILQLALDGHLKLTVSFPNHAKAKIGRVVPYKDVPLKELPSLDGDRILTFAEGYPLHDLAHGHQLKEDDPFIVFDDKIVSIDGLWDLAMCGGFHT